ncbi:MAG: hypothetical protein ACREDR_27815 [Blastocatellia bacterium]
MAQITDQDRSVFSEAYKTTLDNFTGGEQQEIHVLADKLRVVLEAAKKREKVRIASSGG